MSSSFDLTEEQKTFFRAEGHGEKGAVCAIALIYADGRVELDYHDEILRKYAEETDVKAVEARFKDATNQKAEARKKADLAQACYNEAEDYSFNLGQQLKALKDAEVKKK